MRRTVAFVKGVAAWSGLPDDGRPEVAFMGRSNVGKSSLLNAMVGQKGLARVSGTPGKTQELNFYLADEHLYLVDVPGLGYAKVSQKQRARWEALLRRYVTERAPLRLVVHLMDARHDPQPADVNLIEMLMESDAHKVIALTKADKLSANQQQARKAALERLLTGNGLEWPVVLTSAEKKKGMDDLWGWIDLFSGLQP